MTSLHHIGYWVDNLDSAMKQWRRDLGVGPFHVIEHVTFSEFVLTVGDQAYDDVVFDHAAAKRSSIACTCPSSTTTGPQAANAAAWSNTTAS